MNKYEKLIEYIINEQEDKARELFHQIVVEKSRDIYESLVDDEDFEESVGGNAVDSLVDEIEADEQGMVEADMDNMDGEDLELDTDSEGMDDMGDSEEFEMDSDEGMGDEMDDMGGEIDDMGGEGDVESRVQDLESALEELKAEFDALMADEEAEEGNEPGIHDDSESDFDADMESDEKAEEMQKPATESLVREYTEKVAAPSNKTEGGAVGAKGETTSVNKQSIVAKKNDMGGTAANIAKGGAEQSPDNKAVPQPSNKYTKGKGNLPGAGSFENVPGAKTKGYEKKATSYEKQRGAEGQTTGGKMPVASKAVIGSKIR